MLSLGEEIVESIKLVGSLKAMGETEAARELGRKVLSSLSNRKDGLLLTCAYDVSSIPDTSDVQTLLDMAFIATCLEEVYRRFKAQTGGATADLWFKNGENNKALQAFFAFLARPIKQLDIQHDVPILVAAAKALKGSVTYTIPSGLGKYDLNRFLNGLSRGEIRVTKEGIR